MLFGAVSMDSISDTCYKTLENNLALIEDTILFFEKSISLRNHGYQIFNWGARKDLKNEFEQLQAIDHVSLDLISKPLYISSHAFFENFLRDLIVACVNYLNSDPQKITEKSIREHMFLSCKALLSLRQPLDHLEISEKILIANLKKCAGDVAELTATSMVFGFNSTTPDNIESYVKNLGIQLNWNDLGKDSSLKNCTGCERTCDCTKAIKKSLLGMVKNRNRLAHTGSASDISTTTLREHINFVRLFSKAILQLLNDKLSTRR